MAEAILTRGSIDPDSIIVATPGYHTVLVNLMTDDGRKISNAIVNCMDGSINYSYTTNEKGQVLFTCNSGAANIFVNNNYAGRIYSDISDTWMNIDAPIGGISKINFIHNKISIVEFTTNKVFYFQSPREVDLYIVGAGGGAGGSWCAWSGKSGDGWQDYSTGGGGGAGYMNNYYNQNISYDVGYNFIIGVGGVGGNCYNEKNTSSSAMLSSMWSAAKASNKITNGNSGGTSYIVGTSYSAAGGGGGGFAPANGGMTGNWAGSKGIGGLGNGGGTNNSNVYRPTIAAQNSPVTFAGGGGGGGYQNNTKGSPYGGIKGTNNNSNCNGSRGGGGGAGYGGANGQYGATRSGSGGNGLLRIEIH